MRVRLASYNIEHSERFSRVVLDLMRSEQYKVWFPDPDARVPAICPVKEWSTAARSRRQDANPSFVALGLGSGFVGLGVDLLIIDDPYKNREEAFSPVINASIWNWWLEVVVPRLNPETNVIVMFHRWKEDDFAGRLMESGKWEVMRFPAIADGADDDSSGLPTGVALSPRYSLDYLAEIEEEVTSPVFASLYQGTPKPREGSMFKYDWFHRVKGLPAKKLKYVRYIDKAFTEGGGAFTAMVLMAMEVSVRETEDLAPAMRAGGMMNTAPRKRRIIEKRFFIIDVQRGQWGSGQRDENIREIGYCDRRLYPNVVTVIEEEPGATGRDSNRALIKSMPGLSVKSDLVTGAKEVRASDLASQSEIGNVFIVEREASAEYPKPNAWITEYLNEITTFPGSKYKDQVDASSGAFNFLNKMQVTEHITAEDVRKFSIY